MVNFDVTDKDSDTIRQIADRILKIKPEMQAHYIDLCMDLTATHANGCPLDLQGLLDAEEWDLLHDLAGIARHLDRTTGKLTSCFLPRFANLGCACCKEEE